MKSTFAILVKILVMSFISFPLHSKEIAITFDDSPRHASGHFDGPTRSAKLISELKKHKVKQVAFFSVSERLNEEGVKRLKSYSAAGHIIANHTHSHPNFNELSLEDYSADFILADEN